MNDKYYRFEKDMGVFFVFISDLERKSKKILIEMVCENKCDLVIERINLQEGDKMFKYSLCCYQLNNLLDILVVLEEQGYENLGKIGKMI